jgi:hypothetical protein
MCCDSSGTRDGTGLLAQKDVGGSLEVCGLISYGVQRRMTMRSSRSDRGSWVSWFLFAEALLDDVIDGFHWDALLRTRW